MLSVKARHGTHYEKVSVSVKKTLKAKKKLTKPKLIKFQFDLRDEEAEKFNTLTRYTYNVARRIEMFLESTDVGFPLKIPPVPRWPKHPFTAYFTPEFLSYIDGLREMMTWAPKKPSRQKLIRMCIRHWLTM